MGKVISFKPRVGKAKTGLTSGGFTVVIPSVFLLCLSPLLSCFRHTPRNYLVLLFLYSLIEFPFVTSKRKIVWLQFIMLNYWITQKFNWLKNSKFNHLPPPPPHTHTHIYIKSQNSKKIYLNFIWIVNFKPCVPFDF